MNENIPNIRPMALGEILDKAIRLYRQNFLKFIGIFAIPYIPLTLIQMVVSIFYASSIVGSDFLQNPNSTPDPSQVLGLGIATIVGTVTYLIGSFILIGGFATAALTRAVANNYMDKPIGIIDSYRAIKGSVGKLLLALLLAIFFVFLISIWTVIPIVGWFSGPGIFVFMNLIVIPLIAPIASLENLNATQTLRRAWDMGRSRFWWLLGYAFVLAFLGQLIITGPVYVLTAILEGIFASLPSLSFEVQTIIRNIISTLLSMALGLLYSPLQLTMMTVVYFDLRARNEGLDLALQLSSLNENNENKNEMKDLPEISTVQSSSLLTMIDVGRFALLSLIGVVLIGCYFVAIFGILGLAMSASGL